MSTVYAKQYGRLGNNLFQKAAAIGYAVTHGLNYDLTEGIRSSYAARCMHLKEDGHHFNALPAPTMHDRRNVFLDGYWQSEKYFAHCREEVLKAFADTFRWNWCCHPGWCAIHVRRGDYLNYPDKHPAVTDVYLCKAIKHMLSTYASMKFTFFSDDIAWCRGFVNEWGEAFPETQFEFSEGKSQESDLFSMSCHAHQIISNSTFSWWAAWLNQNPDKVVISPAKENWFGPGNAHLCTDDIIPDSWIQIKY